MSLHLDIEKSFPDFKLSARLECENEVVALLGSSGCGKSLALKCIAGIEKPDRGRIAINGRIVFDSEMRINLPPQKRNVGFLFQNYALFQTMPVWRNISCVINKPRVDRAALVANMIDLFQLEGVKDLYPTQISGGQQQRVALARILVSEPDILLLDEPFSALDTHLKWKVEQEITSVLSEFHGTTILVSHDRGEAYRISDRIAVMGVGEIESTGTKEDVFNFPRTLAAALITGCKNVSRAEKVGDFHVEALDWGVTLKTSALVPDCLKHVGVRAHHFELVPSLPEGSEGDNLFSCHAHRIIEEPFEKVIEFSFDGCQGDRVRLHFATSRSDVEHELSRFSLAVPADRIMLLEG